MDEYKQDIIDSFFITIKCPKCGKETHEPVCGKFLPFGHYIVQRHCSNCHHTDVKNHMTGSVRDGIIEEPMYDTIDPFDILNDY